MTPHTYLVIITWILVTYSLCVVGDAAEAPETPPNDRPVYSIPNDPEES